jgi:hypothetical protein
VRLPADDETLRGERIGRLRELGAKVAIAEHLRELGENLQVHVRCALGDQEHEYQAYRTAVGRFECERRAQAQERAYGLTQALHSTVRDRDALAEPRGAEPLTRDQAVEYLAATQALVAREHVADPLEHRFLGRRLYVQRDVRRGEK